MAAIVVSGKSKPETKKNPTRTWQTFVIDRRHLDAKLTALSAEGYQVFALYPALNVAGAYDAVTYREQ